MKARELVNKLLASKSSQTTKPYGKAFSPSNIALCKYWGKRDKELNLPVTSSLSVALPNKGSTTTISLNETADKIYLNDQCLKSDSSFFIKTQAYLDLFRPDNAFFTVDTNNNIPTAAGLASSASGFAALIKALDDLFNWQLTESELSILARIGSGSACRSLWNGFVEWTAGTRDDGLDSFSKPLNIEWPELCIGLCIFETKQKPISSTDAMNITTQTSKLYQQWPAKVETYIETIRNAIISKDFELLGKTAEDNALFMHQTMIEATPSIDYSTAQTLAIREKVAALRSEGIPVYFTQDAGPNVKLLFLQASTNEIAKAFSEIEIISCFD